MPFLIPQIEKKVTVIAQRNSRSIFEIPSDSSTSWKPSIDAVSAAMIGIASDALPLHAQFSLLSLLPYVFL